MPAIVPLGPPVASLYPQLQVLQAGGRVPPMCFAYPEHVRRFRLGVELGTSWTLVGLMAAMFLAAAAMAASEATRSGWVARFLLAAFFALPALGLPGFMGVYARQMREFADGLEDVIEVDGAGLHVVREGRREPASLVEVRANHGFRNHRGLNSTRAALRVGEETRWYDPAHMVEVED